MSDNRLWVDDKREPPTDGHWLWSKSAQNTIDTLMLTTERFAVISLDYSLGRDWDDNGGTVLQWLGEHPDKWPTHEVRLHSGSSSGRGLLKQLADECKPAGWTGSIINTGGF